MTIEEIDLYKLRTEDVLKYLPEGERGLLRGRELGRIRQDAGGRHLAGRRM